MITHNAIFIKSPVLIVPICKMGLFNPKYREEGTGRAGVKLAFQDTIRQADIFPG